MSFTAQELTDDLLRRVRDAGGGMHSRTFARSILSKVQQSVNAKYRNALEFTFLTTEKLRQIYSISVSLPSALFVDAVRVPGFDTEGGRDIPFTRWRELSQGDPQWFRRQGDRIEVFSLIGRDLLVLHPALPVATTVNVLYTRITTAWTSETDVTEIDDDLVPEMMRLSEAVLLTVGRRLEQVKAMIQPEGAAVA
jgi:hypothetical protein